MKKLRPLEHISESGHVIECHSKKAPSKATLSKEPNQTLSTGAIRTLSKNVL